MTLIKFLLNICVIGHISQAFHKLKKNFQKYFKFFILYLKPDSPNSDRNVFV